MLLQLRDYNISRIFQKEGDTMNEIIKSIETRRSVRSYKPDMIPQEIIDRICEAGTYAASGMGKQHREKATISIIYNRRLYRSSAH